MPSLIDIATIKFGKQAAADTRKGMYELRRMVPQSELSFANKLRTSTEIGSEANLGKVSLPTNESEEIFANWRSELERTPIHDLCEHKPLNQVKNSDQEDLQAFIRERKHKEWLAEVDARIKELGFFK